MIQENARRLVQLGEPKPSEATPRNQPRAGDRIRWLGRLWRVNWAHRGLISIVSLEPPVTELINEDGSDGPFEVLPS